MILRSTRAAALAAAAGLALAGCSGSGNDSTATVTVTAGDTASATGAAGDGGGAGGAAATQAPAGDGAATATLTPATVKTITVDEKKTVSAGDTAFTLTVHNVTVQDYYVEAEVTIVNDAAARLTTWWGGASTSPRLYDETARTYPFVPDPGHVNKYLELQGGEGADAVLVFVGRVPDNAQTLTLDFQDVGASWTQVLFEIPLGGN